MGNSVKRPWSVWIAQIFFVYCIFIFILSFVLVMMATERADRSFAGVLITNLMGVVFIVLFATAFWGMAERKRYGRWLGVGLLSFMMIFMNVSKVLLPGPAEGTVGMIIRILLCVLLFVVALHIAFSERADAFFPRKVDSRIVDHPPPPPTFDN